MNKKELIEKLIDNGDILSDIMILYQGTLYEISEAEHDGDFYVLKINEGDL